MTDKTYPLIEGNKMIAEFMGGIRKEPKNFPAYYQFFDSEGLITRQSPEERLKYHTSWDWLMPVVEKIESIVDKHHGHFAVYIGSNGCTIQATNFRPDKPIPDPPHYFADYTYETKIKATWRAVTEFIQWYNQQNIKL